MAHCYNGQVTDRHVRALEFLSPRLLWTAAEAPVTAARSGAAGRAGEKYITLACLLVAAVGCGSGAPDAGRDAAPGGNEGGVVERDAATLLDTRTAGPEAG